MFDFFRKRSAPSKAATAAPAADADRAITSPVRQSKQAAMTQAEEVAHDEAAAVDFILQCEFADARLIAAQHIYSRPMAERVLQALRNTDRRVAKLMQARLEMCKQWELDEQQATQCIAQAEKLTNEPQLLPNQVVDLDKAWQKISKVAPPLQQSFQAARMRLEQRLAAQTTVQRAVINALHQLQELEAKLAPDTLADTEQKILSLEQQMERQATSPEAPSLPRHLLMEFTHTAARLKQALQQISQHQQAFFLRQKLLESWEADASSLADLKELKRAWDALPALPEEMAAPLQERLALLCQRIGKAHSTQAAPAVQDVQTIKRQFTETLQHLEQALEEGALQAAADCDRSLRSIDAKTLALSAEQTGRLHKARAELHRLQGWARWGGQVSREELLQAAEALPEQSLPIPELARKVGSLRERWKSLDISAGPAGKELWQRFDQACTLAYAPAAAHFKERAQERENNLQKARDLVEEARQFVAGQKIEAANADDIDWKSVVQFSERMHRRWQSLGIIPRQERKKLEVDFEAAMHVLSDRLAQQRQVEIQQRENLIAQAESLDPQDRGLFDVLHALQQRWQQHAKALPLEHGQEQALWQRFRNACDRVVSQRKETSRAADAERHRHLKAKETLCAQLETAHDAPEAMIGTLLRNARDAWNAIGPVPRAAEQQIDARYRQAQQALQQRLDEIKRQKNAGEVHALHRKLSLCLTLEQQLDGRAEVENAQLNRLQAEWQSLPELKADMEAMLRARFDRDIAALRAGDQAYAALLKDNQPLLLRELLRLEILTNLESPPEFSRERLQLQVEVLQSTLKAGMKTPVEEKKADLSRLCGLPAYADQQAVARIARVIEQLAAS